MQFVLTGVKPLYECKNREGKTFATVELRLENRKDYEDVDIVMRDSMRERAVVEIASGLVAYIYENCERLSSNVDARQAVTIAFPYYSGVTMQIAFTGENLTDWDYNMLIIGVESKLFQMLAAYAHQTVGGKGEYYTNLVRTRNKQLEKKVAFLSETFNLEECYHFSTEVAS